MISIISIQEREKWDRVVASFKNYDVYYLSGYVNAFRIHGDGEPILVHVEHDGVKAMAVYMKRDVADDPRMPGLIKGRYFDLITPYGYGGLLFEGDLSSLKVKYIVEELKAYYRSENIVCEFVRWHPILKNVEVFRDCGNVIDLGKTIHMELSSKEVIWNNITSKNRNTIRRAEKSGVKIEHSTNPLLFETFIDIYNQTMKKDNADTYYYFEPAFYQSIANDLTGHYEIFYALLEEKIIAMSIMIFANNMMHYHLSGSLVEYRNMNPSNLLLYEAACWGVKQGFTTFHLGGGVGSGEDNLFKFKQSFNRYSGNQFSISKIVHDADIYNELLDYRKNIDVSFDQDSSFFPLYRS